MVKTGTRALELGGAVARCGWEGVEVSFFKSWFRWVHLGHPSHPPHHFLGGDCSLSIYHTFSKGNILAGVTALPIHYVTPSIRVRSLARSGCWRANPTRALAFSGCGRAISGHPLTLYLMLVFSLRDHPYLCEAVLGLNSHHLLSFQKVDFFPPSPEGEVRLESGSLTRCFVKGSNSHFSHFHQGRWIGTTSHFKSWHVNS